MGFCIDSYQHCVQFHSCTDGMKGKARCGEKKDTHSCEPVNLVFKLEAWERGEGERGSAGRDTGGSCNEWAEDWKQSLPEWTFTKHIPPWSHLLLLPSTGNQQPCLTLKKTAPSPTAAFVTAPIKRGKTIIKWRTIVKRCPVNDCEKWAPQRTQGGPESLGGRLDLGKWWTRHNMFTSLSLLWWILTCSFVAAAHRLLLMTILIRVYVSNPALCTWIHWSVHLWRSWACARWKACTFSMEIGGSLIAEVFHHVTSVNDKEPWGISYCSQMHVYSTRLFHARSKIGLVYGMVVNIPEKIGRPGRTIRPKTETCMLSAWWDCQWCMRWSGTSFGVWGGGVDVLKEMVTWQL